MCFDFICDWFYWILPQFLLAELLKMSSNLLTAGIFTSKCYGFCNENRNELKWSGSIPLIWEMCFVFVFDWFCWLFLNFWETNCVKWKLMVMLSNDYSLRGKNRNFLWKKRNDDLDVKTRFIFICHLFCYILFNFLLDAFL